MELNLKKLMAEIEADTKLDELNLKEAQFKLPAIKHKYAGLLIRSKIELNEKLKKHSDTKKQLIKKIHDSSPVKLTPNAMSDAAEDAPSVKSINDEIKDLKLVIELLEKTEKILQSMTFDIKNIIELQKLETT